MPIDHRRGPDGSDDHSDEPPKQDGPAASGRGWSGYGGHGSGHVGGGRGGWGGNVPPARIVEGLALGIVAVIALFAFFGSWFQIEPDEGGVVQQTPVRVTCLRTLNATTFASVRSSVAVNSSQATKGESNASASRKRSMASPSLMLTIPWMVGVSTALLPR